MTNVEINLARERYEQAKAKAEAAHREEREAELAYLEARGQGDGHDAQFIRAFLDNDLITMSRLCRENEARFRAQHPDYHARQEAEIAEAAARIGSVQ